VCSHVRRVEIDQAMLDPRNSSESIAKRFGVTYDPVWRHRKLHLAEKVSRALEIHQRIAGHLEATATSADLLKLYEQTRQDWESARERGDWSTAIKAVRELTRIIELQARLVLQAGEQRARDVAGHPVFRSWIAKQSRLLCEPCAKATHDLACRELGLDVPLSSLA
jgi:hypothetical protein